MYERLKKKIAEAYRKIGFDVTSRTWINWGDRLPGSKMYCCPMTALALEGDGADRNLMWRLSDAGTDCAMIENIVINTAANLLKLPLGSRWVRGFVCGFDDYDLHPEFMDDRGYVAGHKVGKAMCSHFLLGEEV